MPRLLRGAVPLALIVAAGAAAGGTPPDRGLGTLLLDRTSPRVDAIVAGVPVMLAVLPGDGFELAAAVAARVPVEWTSGRTLAVGRVIVPVRDAIAPVGIGGVTVKAPITSQPQPCCRGLDGAIGAADMPWSIVRIGDPQGLPEQRFAAGRDDRGQYRIAWRVGAETLDVLLAPDNPETVATAAAAAVLARAYGGHLQDTVRAVSVIYGIARPVRDMVFDRPVPLLGFAITRIAVRIDDFAGDAGLLVPFEPDRAAASPDDIVVSHRPVPPQRRWPGVSIGRDLLDNCPAITVYRRQAVGLACRAG